MATSVVANHKNSDQHNLYLRDENQIFCDESSHSYSNATTNHALTQTLPPRATAPSDMIKSTFDSVQAPSIFKKTSHLTHDPRRDSGMAPSVASSTAASNNASTSIQYPSAQDSSDETPTPSRPTTTASAIPSIVIYDPNVSQLPMSSADSPLAPLESENGKTENTDSKPIPSASQAAEPNDFNGILTTDIPTGGLDDPFSADSLQFSKRGSVLVKGKTAPVTARRNRLPEQSPSKTIKSYTDVPAPRTSNDKDAELAKMSPEERRLSRRVRSLYEGYEAAESVPHLASDISDSRLNDRLDDIGEEDEAASPVATPPRKSDQRLGGNCQSPSAMSSRASIRRDFREAAGGLEDWTDVDIKDVDRYGFIRQRKPNSKRSSALSLSLPGTADGPRPPTSTISLGVVDEDPPQTSLTARDASRPASPSPSKPQRLSLFGSSNRKTSPSLLSFRSKKSVGSTIGTFRSTSSRKPYNKGSRWLDEAGDMLTIPIGLGGMESDDDDDSSDEAKAKRKTESRRNAKWAKMAIEMPSPLDRALQSGKPATPNEKRAIVGGGRSYTFDTSSNKLISRVWKGIPDRWRAVAWHSFLTTSAARRSPTGRPIPSDEALTRRFYHLQTLDCPDDTQIDMDVPRTIGSHIMFRKRYRGGQRLLFRVLRALALQYPRIGYVQGMAPIAATLLCYFEEEKAFVIGCRLWELRGVGWLYGGPGATSSNLSYPEGDNASNKAAGFEGLMTALSEFERDWMSGTAVGSALNELNVAPTSFGTKWYLTLFSYSMPFRAMLRVWDVFILLGDPPYSPPLSSSLLSSNTVNGTHSPRVGDEELDGEHIVDLSVLHAVGASLVHGLADVLIGADFENAMKALTSSLPVGKEDVLIRVAKREWEERYVKKIAVSNHHRQQQQLQNGKKQK